jgi:hypothetical protein
MASQGEGPSGSATTSRHEGPLESLTQRIGRELVARVNQYQSSPLEAAGDQAMVMLATRPHVRSRLLRFVDALAGLEADRSGAETARLLREYLSGDFSELPAALAPFLDLAMSPV